MPVVFITLGDKLLGIYRASFNRGKLATHTITWLDTESLC